MNRPGGGANRFDEGHQFQIVGGQHEHEDRANEREKPAAALAPGNFFAEVENLLENPLEEVGCTTRHKREVALGDEAEGKHDEHGKPGGEEGIGDGYWPNKEKRFWSDLNIWEVPEHPKVPLHAGPPHQSMMLRPLPPCSKRCTAGNFRWRRKPHR